MDPVRVSPKSLQFRLGIDFRPPRQTPPPPESLLAARYVRIQVSSPPPDRVDGRPWADGLWEYDAEGGYRAFDPKGKTWKKFGVFPQDGISSFGLPRPETIVLDKWLAVPAVRPPAALTTAFTLSGPDEPTPGANHFISVPYPRPRVDGDELDVAAVNYYCEGELSFTKDVRDWVGISFDRSWPPDRSSADYVVAVDATAKREGRPLLPYPVEPAW